MSRSPSSGPSDEFLIPQWNSEKMLESDFKNFVQKGTTEMVFGVFLRRDFLSQNEIQSGEVDTKLDEKYVFGNRIENWMLELEIGGDFRI